MKKAQLCLGVACVTAACALFIWQFAARHRRSAQIEVSDWQDIPDCPAGTIVTGPDHGAKLWFDGKDWKVVAGTCSDILDLRLKVTPAGSPSDGKIEPLVSTGAKGAANLVCLITHSDGEYQVGADVWGVEMKGGRPFRLSEPAFFLDLIIDRVNNRIRATRNGEIVYETFLKPWPFAHNIWTVGSNPLGGSFVADKFTGEVTVESTHGSADSSERRGHAAADLKPPPGAAYLNVFFGRPAPGHGLPLLTAGSAGQADLFYAKVDDQTHLHFGFDHWGAGGAVSPPVEYDPNIPHLIVIKWGGMPALGGVQRQMDRSYSVTLDGKEVFKGEASFFQATIQQVFVGSNPVGASTADAVFTGEIIEKGISL
jgi:hypothetical protein